MNDKKETLLRLGPDVIQKLLPHRRPLLMVDRVESFTRSPVPSLRGSRFISANEEVFAGHFPGLHLWPGIYTIEGMGQTANVLEALMALVEGAEAAGRNADELLQGLLAIEAGYSLKVVPRDDKLAMLLEKLSNSRQFMGMSISVEAEVDGRVVARGSMDSIMKVDAPMG